MYDAIASHKVTHLCGAPIVMATLLNAPADEKRPLPHVVEFFTAAAPPPEAVLAAMKEAGFNVTHLYGLTECYGPAVVNDWHGEWETLASAEQAVKKARQGVRYGALEGLDVRDPETMAPVAHDGANFGRSDDARQRRDEGLSQEQSIDREGVHRRLVSHRRPRRDAPRRLYPAQGPLERHHHFRRREHLPRSRWRTRFTSIRRSRSPPLWQSPTTNGARPPAPSSSSSPARRPPPTSSRNGAASTSASYKCPRYVVFAEIPKTSTGKIQKFKLRRWQRRCEGLRAGHDLPLRHARACRGHPRLNGLAGRQDVDGRNSPAMTSEGG